MAVLEGRREIEFLGLRCYGVGNRLPAMARVDAPEPRTRIEQLTTARVPIIHAFRTREQARTRLEAFIWSERLPKGRGIGWRHASRSGWRHGGHFLCEGQNNSKSRRLGRQWN